MYLNNKYYGTDVCGRALIVSLVHQKRLRCVPGWKEGGMRSVVVVAITSVSTGGRTPDNSDVFQMRASILSLCRYKGMEPGLFLLSKHLINIFVC